MLDPSRRRKKEVYGFVGAQQVKGGKRHLIAHSLGQVGTEYRPRPCRVSRGGISPRGSLHSGGGVVLMTHPTREFAVIAKRSAVERTFTRCNLYRCLSKDYALLPEVSEVAIYLPLSTSRCAVLPLLNFPYLHSLLSSKAHTVLLIGERYIANHYLYRTTKTNDPIQTALL